MDSPRSLPVPRRRFGAAEWEAVRRGMRPQAMEEKWEAWCDGRVLHLHRSWTGKEIFRLTFAPAGEEWIVAEALVESDPRNYQGTDRDASFAVLLIDALMLDGADPAEQFRGVDRELRANASLAGLSVGDALGSQFFVPENRHHHENRTTPPGPWQWTDDTQMAAVLTTHLRERGEVDQDALAAGFAAVFDLYRGYGPGAARLLRQVRDGGDWRRLVTEMFDGGSFGNGAAMRVAPLGAWFADDLDRAVAEAALSAEVTHAHPDGIAGAVAVAVAAALAAADETPGATDFLAEVGSRTPPGKVLDGLKTVRGYPADTDPDEVARAVGNGSRTTAADTVPFCLWVAAHHLGGFREAFWATAAVGGDIDTTCAIVGGIVAAHTGPSAIPSDWTAAREPLEDDRSR